MIFVQGHFGSHDVARFFPQKLLIEMNSNNANGLIVFNLPKSKNDMRFDHLRSLLHLKFT